MGLRPGEAAASNEKGTGERRQEQGHREELIDYMQGLDVIDCHEHLAMESERVAQEVDVLTLLGGYASLDLQVAGMNNYVKNGNQVIDYSIPLETRWKNTWPYLQQLNDYRLKPVGSVQIVATD